MSKNEKIYRKLSEQFTDEEIADSMMIPADLTPTEQEAANEELRAFRFKLLAEKTEEQRIYSDLLRFRYQIENYLENEAYDPAMKFGVQLEEYTRILKRTKKKLSEELNIHYTRLSRIFNDKETANVELVYRLEEHSGQLVPALIWWRLIAKRQEFEIMQDKTTRKIEAAKVKRAVANRA